MAAYSDILNQPVRNLPLRPLLDVGPDTPTRDVLAQLRAKKLGCAIVVSEDGKPLGTFTERVVCDGVKRGADFLAEPVGKHLDPNWACVATSDPVAKVVDTVKDRRLRFLCVTDEKGKAVGLTGQKGLMEYIASYVPHHVQVIAGRVGRDAFSSKREGA